MIRRSKDRVLAIFQAIAATSLVTVGAAAATGSCSAPPDPTRVTEIATPDFLQFTGNANQVGVSAFLEKRCATLDCHGQVGRPLRLYSFSGLRYPDDQLNYPGKGGLEPIEEEQNYESIVALQPEQLSRVRLDPATNPVDTLLIVRKPRGVERHKGGQVLTPGDDGDTCLTSWLAGTVNAASCAAAARVP